MKFFTNFLKNKKIPRGETYHMQDYQSWGNAINWTNWPELKINGHLTRRPTIGDILTCDFVSGAKHEFQFIQVEYVNDPTDMFFAEVKHLGEIESENII